MQVPKLFSLCYFVLLPCKDFGWLSLWGQGTAKICFSSKCDSWDHVEKERILDSRIASCPPPENAGFPLLFVSLETPHTDTWHSSAANFSKVQFHWLESFLFVTGECKTGHRRLTGKCFPLTAMAVSAWPHLWQFLLPWCHYEIIQILWGMHLVLVLP